MYTGIFALSNELSDKILEKCAENDIKFNTLCIQVWYVLPLHDTDLFRLYAYNHVITKFSMTVNNSTN